MVDSISPILFGMIGFIAVFFLVFVSLTGKDGGV